MLLRNTKVIQYLPSIAWKRLVKHYLIGISGITCDERDLNGKSAHSEVVCFISISDSDWYCDHWQDIYPFFYCFLFVK